MRLGGSLVYVDLGSAAINDPSPLTGLIADYRSKHYLAVGFNANWTFGR